MDNQETFEQWNNRRVTNMVNKMAELLKNDELDELKAMVNNLTKLNQEKVVFLPQKTKKTKKKNNTENQ